MRRVIVISLAGIALSGCASMSVPGLDFLTPAPSVATLQLESMPPGAEARTSAGPSCRTPCTVSVPAAPLTVTYHARQVSAADRLRAADAANRRQSQRGRRQLHSSMELDPNPVFAELAPAGPPKRTTKRPPPKQVAKRPPAAASPFPPPSRVIKPVPIS